MPITITSVTPSDATKLLSLSEGHFLDFKAKEIKPAKLSLTISAFANAEGGELYIGIDETPAGFVWRGFDRVEDANSHVHVFEELFPLGEHFSYEFLQCSVHHGCVLHVSIKKNPGIVRASDGTIHLRRNAGKIPIDTSDKLRRLELDKGIHTFEDETIDVDILTLTESVTMSSFLTYAVPKRGALDFLKQELLIRLGIPRVAAILLYADIPQSALPNRAAVKIARYKTGGSAIRDALQGTPQTIEGPLIDLITNAVARTKEIVEEARVETSSGPGLAGYPHETLHEIITNALIHRDYSIQDHVQVRIFDNRIEIESPGRLPGHVTVTNILDTRTIRNGKIVRLINKFPNPPNKDMGEGLNAAAEAMRKVRLKPPRFQETATSFVVTIPHEPLATAQELIMEFLDGHPTITNREARALYPVDTQHAMRSILYRMMSQGMIEQVPDSKRGGTKYRKPTGSP